MTKPNIIFYFSDQQRADTLNNVLMPNLTAVAAEGITFTDSYTCQPVCGPARACLQTGVYATKNGSVVNGVPLNPNIKPLSAYLKQAGYRTAYVGKWHLASDFLPNKGVHCETTAVPRDRQGGYDYWRAADVLEFTSHGYGGYVFDEAGTRIDFSGYRADAINDFALEYLDEQDNSQPFFLFVSQLEPHHQNDSGRYEGKAEYIREYQNYPIPEDLLGYAGDYRKSYPDYCAAIRAIDECIARLIKKLKEKGLYENTILIYTSDHGSHFKVRNAEYKRSCHDASIHTPLVMVGGGLPHGVDNRLVSLIDLPATILDLAKVSVPETYDGVSVIAQIEQKAAARDAVFVQISESQIGRAIRTQRYTYSVKRGGARTVIKCITQKRSPSPTFTKRTICMTTNKTLTKKTT